MRIIMAAAFSVTATLIGGCASGESYVKAGFDFEKLDRIAIATVAGDLETEQARNQIADFFATELEARGYTLMSRAEVDGELKSRRVAISEEGGIRAAIRAGLALDVPAVLAVDVRILGEEITIAAKMIDVETGGILWMAEEQQSPRQGPAGIFKPPAKTDNLRGSGGPGLSAEKVERARKLIRKICKTLPAKKR